MRTVKRDRVEQSYKKGYQCGLKGRPMHHCPFQEINKRGSWLGGWREGHDHYLSGTVFPVDH